jgi:hypothetical protein
MVKQNARRAQLLESNPCRVGVYESLPAWNGLAGRWSGVESAVTMAEYRITYWREIPSMVTAREGEATAKSGLPARFQEAIDEAAMRQNMAGSDAYLEQWQHGEWQPGEGSPDELASGVAERLDAEYNAARLESMLEE